MLFICLIKTDAEYRRNPEIAQKSHKWWNDGGRPVGLKTVACYGAIGTDTPDVMIVETDNHLDIQRMVDFWAPVRIEVHPGIDLARHWGERGMNIE